MGGIMKKGFTLIELLIVMVIISVLVAVALPKYRASMERGRGVEGIANLKASSDWINTLYVMNDNQYPTNAKLTTTESINGQSVTVVGANTRSMYFTPVQISSTCLSGYKCLETQRKQGNTVYYTLKAYNKDGELYKIECTGTEKELCKPMGMSLVESAYVLSYN